MTHQPAGNSPTLTPFEQLRYAGQILHTEGQALITLAQRLDADFNRAIDMLLNCRGSVIVSGMGKAGLVGQKIVATLASTGTRSHFLHPGEAVHGDLGRVHRDDVLLVLSFSGETEEIARLLPPLAELGVPIIAVTGARGSSLGLAAQVVLDLGPIHEACPLGLAPSTSTTAMLALGDALALVTSRRREFRAEDFARFHPAGSLGRRLARVEEVMRPLDQCRVASADQSVRQIFVGLGRPGRRTGAIMLTDDDGRLCGLFTDSDLARIFESRRDEDLDGPIRSVMSAGPTSVPLGSRLPDAVRLLASRKFSELPVIDHDGRPAGLIDVTDVVGLPAEDEASLSAPSERSADRLAGEAA